MRHLTTNQHTTIIADAMWSLCADSKLSQGSVDKIESGYEFNRANPIDQELRE